MIGLVNRIKQALELVDSKALRIGYSIKKYLELTFVIVIEEM